jgi:hypothetical protein
MVIPKFQWTICFALVGVLHQQKTNVTKIVGRLYHTNKGGMDNIFCLSWSSKPTKNQPYKKMLVGYAIPTKAEDSVRGIEEIVLKTLIAQTIYPSNPL